MKKINKDIIAVFILVILVCGLFYKTFLGNILVLGDFTGSDLIDLHLPFKYILHNNYAQRQFPLWEPNMSMGFPIIAEGQSGPFYPIHILLSLLPQNLSYLGLSLSIISSLLLAAVFTYLYARSLNFSRFSSLFTAITFTFSGFFISRLKHVNMIAAAAWVPFVFWSIRKLFKKKKLIYALLAGSVIAIQFLAGHPQITFYSLFIYAIYFAFEFFSSSKQKDYSSTLPIAGISIFVIGIVAIGLSAIQILPTLEFTGLTERTEYTYQTATSYPFHPKNLITFISPYYLGNPATGSYRQDITSTGIFWENASYIGLLPLILALWAIIFSLRKKPKLPYNSFFIILAIISLFLMLGRFTPLFDFLWQNFPGFQLFRFPTRFNLFLILSLSILAGYGAQLLLDKIRILSIQPRTRKKSSDEASFSWPLNTWQTQALILSFVVLDLFVFAYAYLSFYPADKMLETPEAVSKISEDNETFRIYSLTQYGQSPYSTVGWKSNQNAILAIRRAVPPNNNIIYNLASFTDRGWFEGGLSTKRRNRVENFLIRENQDSVLTGKLLGTFNVKYILTFAETLGIEIELLEEFEMGEEYATTLKLFKNNQFIPRAIFVPEAEIINDEEAVFDRLISLDFLPTKTVILEQEPNEIPTEYSGILDEFRKENPVEISSYQNQEVIIKVDAKQHGFLVLSDLYYPGWKVSIDGEDQEIFQANYLSRAVELEEGNHTIRFYFEPTSFKIGAIITATTLSALLFSLVFYLSKNALHLLKLKVRKSPRKLT